MAEGSVPLTSLTAEQLDNIRGQLEKEVAMLQQNVQSLLEAQQRLQASQETAASMPELTGKEAMVPFTDGVYVLGTIEDTSRVLVDLGTGYYVEKTPHDAKKYFGRRLVIVKENVDKATSALNTKQRNLEAVRAILQSKLQSASPSAS